MYKKTTPNIQVDKLIPKMILNKNENFKDFFHLIVRIRLKNKKLVLVKDRYIHQCSKIEHPETGPTYIGLIYF